VLLASAITGDLLFFLHAIIHLISAKTNTRDDKEKPLYDAWLLIIFLNPK
jgi:hypothetical protein